MNQHKNKNLCLCFMMFATLFFSIVLVSNVHADSMSAGDLVRMVASNVAVRSCKSTTCTNLGRLPLGTIGTVLSGPDTGNSYIWCYVGWNNGVTGWTPNPKNNYWYYEKPSTTSPGYNSENYDLISDTTPTLRWQQVDNAVTYRIAIRKVSNNSLILDRNISGSSTLYTVPFSLEQGAQYYWDIAPRDTDGDFGLWSDARYFEIENNIIYVPNPPGTIAATDGDFTDKVLVSWSLVSSATSYKIYRCTNNSTSSCGTNYTSTASPYSDTNATPGITYYYRVKACNNAGCSSLSSSYSAGRRKVSISIPSPPDTVAATDGNFVDKVLVSWSLASSATSYRIYRCTNNSTSSCGTSYTSSTSPYSDTNATPGIIYYYRVKSCNNAGCSVLSSSYGSGHRQEDLLGNFTLSITDNSCNGTIPNTNLDWSVSSGAVSYKIHRNKPFSNGSLWLDVPSSSTQFDVKTDLQENTSYTYYVRAYSSSGDYRNSNSITVTTKECTTIEVPTPVINSIAPSTLDINDAPLMIHINGSGFTSRTKVFWNTNTNTTWRNISNTYVNNESITVNIHSFGNKARTWSLKVVNAADKYDTYSFVVTKHSQAAINTVRERIETISSDISYKDAVVITHGMNSKISAPWVKELADEICKSIGVENPIFNPNGKKDGLFLYCENDDWDVYVYDWSDAADDGATPLAAPWVWDRAIYPGNTLGNRLGVQQYNYVHLIAHSAGSHVINRASMLIKQKSPNTITHLTFLDPYHPHPAEICGDFAGASYADITYNIEKTYGKYADFTDNYFEIATLDIGIGGLAFDTNLILKNAFNVDLTALDSICMNNWPYNSSGVHGCPIWYYINTIKSSGYPYGFSFSKENTGSDPSTHLKPLLGKICVLNGDKTCGVTPYAKKCRMMKIKTSVNNAWIAGIEPLIPVQEQVESITGDVVESLSNAGRYIVDLFTGSPVWFEWTLNAEKQFNALEFDYEFHNGAEGLLTVLLDDIPIYQLDERLLSRNEKKTTQTLYFNGLEVGPHSLGFRIDPYSTQQSRATISNIKFKLIEKNIEKDHLCFPVKAKNKKVVIICL